MCMLFDIFFIFFCFLLLLVTWLAVQCRDVGCAVVATNHRAEGPSLVQLPTLLRTLYREVFRSADGRREVLSSSCCIYGSVHILTQQDCNMEIGL